MFFLNLTFVQFAAILASVSAIVVTLYLLDRARRRQPVATLRFWVAAEHPAIVARRKKIQQPWSLLLQLLSIALLLAAIAQLRVGSESALPFDHVLVLETSAWMGARVPGARTPGTRTAGSRNRPHTLMDEAQSRARAYLKALPQGDRVMLIRADALATPATAFEPDRKKLERAIAESEPGSTALNLEQALDFARQVQSLSARRSGEVVYIGSSRVSEREVAANSTLSAQNLRILPLPDAGENCGLRKIGLRRTAADPALWEVFASVRNYGSKPQTVSLSLQFGGAPAGARGILLPAGAEREVTFEYRTKAAGLLEVRLSPLDSYPEDNRAVIELPQLKTLAVVVYSNEPELLRPALEANPRIQATFRPTSEYSAKPDAALVILDRFKPPSRPAVDSIWIDPPADGSPIAIVKRVTGAKVTRWHTQHALGQGLRTRDVTLESAAILNAAPEDIRIAEVEGGPFIVARPGKPKIVVLGFHPVRSALRYELATPLLFANTLRWMAGDMFRRSELLASSAGAITAAFDTGVNAADVHVLQEDGKPLPFSVRDRTVQFFSGNPGTVRLTAGDREMVYSLILPEVSEAKWEPPAGVKRGVPAARSASVSSFDLWQILALLGAAGLLLEWFLYGRFGRQAMPRADGASTFFSKLRVVGRDRA